MEVSEALTVGDLRRIDLDELLGRFDLTLEVVGDDDDIPGSFWGDREAGIAGSRVYARADTPVHSVLHESCHVICMDPERRAGLDTDAGGDDIEEAAVCFLQILLSDFLPGVGRKRIVADMDRWGYSFRLGSTERWFQLDAEDARAWLLGHGLVTASGEPSFRLRG